MLFSKLRLNAWVAALLPLANATTDPICVTESRPNPVKDEYPNDVTGMLNATILIAPITLETARQIVPHPILESAYRHLLPDFPEGMYPMLVQPAVDHDLQYQGVNAIADFSRVGYEFPFVDLLGNGYSSFRWLPEQFISADNPTAIEGSRTYGIAVSPGIFDPACDIYATQGDGNRFKGKSTDEKKTISIEASPGDNPSAPSPQLYDFYKNVTNQPAFGDGTDCDWQMRLFNTSLSEAPYTPNAVKASVQSSNFGPFSGDESFEGLEGIQFSSAFIEWNHVDCSTLADIEV